MKAHLMYRDADFEIDSAEPPRAADLEQDLELGRVLDAMADGDAFDRAVARSALLHPLRDEAAIRYRQEALEDCRRETAAVDAVYALTGRALATERDVLLYVMSDGQPHMRLQRAVRILRALQPIIRELRVWAEGPADRFRSDAFRAFVGTIRTDLGDETLQRLDTAVGRLELREGLLFSATLGGEGQTVGQVLRRPREENRRSLGRTPLKRPHVSFTLPARDEEALDHLTNLQNRSVLGVADAASQAVDHVLAFFAAVRRELAFYRGCLRLADRLTAIGVELCTPVPLPADTDAATALGLAEPSLALEIGRAPVRNDVVLGSRHLVVVTGANHGGKSTTLRSLGLAQLFMQAGMPVPAARFEAPIAGGVFTHWSREEDSAEGRGKFDDELARMSAIVDVIEPGDLLLSNESFSSTNEREGSEVAHEVVTALLRAGVQVRLVTHLFALSSALHRDGDGLFLRAPRSTGGGVSPLEEEPPVSTSWGVDLFDRAFGTHLADEAAADQVQ